MKHGLFILMCAIAFCMGCSDEEDDSESVIKSVRKITYREELNSDKIHPDMDYPKNIDRTFDYDKQGRVVRIEVLKTQSDSTWNDIYTFDYSVAGEIGIKQVESGNESETLYYRAKLNAQGNVSTLQFKERQFGMYEDYITFKYTADGRLAQWEGCNEYKNKAVNYTYTDGNLSKYEIISYSSENTHDISVETSYPNKYPNNGAIDFLGYAVIDDDYDFLFHIGRLGKSGDYLLEHFSTGTRPTSKYEHWSLYTRPNQIVHCTFKYVVWPKDPELVFAYEFDNDKNLTKIVATEAFVVMSAEWDEVVGSELKVPGEPQYGYQYVIKNQKYTKVRDWEDVYTYTISY